MIYVVQHNSFRVTDSSSLALQNSQTSPQNLQNLEFFLRDFMISICLQLNISSSEQSPQLTRLLPVINLLHWALPKPPKKKKEPPGMLRRGA